MGNFWKKIIKRKGNNLNELQREIAKGQEEIITPSEIELARRRFLEDDLELVKILLEAEQALARDDLRTAENLALEAIKRDRKCAQAYVIIGRIATLRGGFDDAKEAYKTAIKCNSELGEAYFGLGEIYFRSDNISEAIENLQRAVSLDRSRADWQALLGKAYVQVRQFGKAAKALKRATVLDIDNKEYRELAIEAEEKQRSHAQAFRIK